MQQWVSLAAGLAGLGYNLLAGAVRAMRRSLARSQPLAVPWLAVLSLLLDELCPPLNLSKVSTRWNAPVKAARARLAAEAAAWKPR